MNGHTRLAFEYATLRVMPRVDRGEFLNVGVLLYCQPAEFLAARFHLDPARLRCLDPALEMGGIEAALRAVEAASAGEPGAGPVASEPPGARFRWLTAPRSTVVQPGPVHAGMTDDPGAELERLLGLLVRQEGPGPIG